MIFEDFSLHIKDALANLVSAKMRSVLAILGILVGTASVVAMVTCGEIATEKALQQFKALGTDLLAISFFTEKPTDQKSTVDVSTIEKLKTLSPNIITVAPYATLYSSMTFDGKNLQGSIIGVTENLQNVIKIKIKTGRFISFLDRYSYFCVIGNSIYQKMQQTQAGDPTGQQLQIGDNYFTIIGVADTWPENGFFNEDVNESVLIPVQIASLVSKNANINNLIIQLKTNSNIDDIEDKITQFLKTNLGEVKLFFRSAKEIIYRMEKQQQIFTLLLGLIGSISLLVGGIGVMNIMLVSVVERRREIGIRMAVGAKRKDIRSLFLIESITLTFFGGALGVILGIITSYIITILAKWDFSLFLLPPLIGFAVSAAIGIFFGFYPASQAAKLDPIQTLRSE